MNYGKTTVKEVVCILIDNVIVRVDRRIQSVLHGLHDKLPRCGVDEPGLSPCVLQLGHYGDHYVPGHGYSGVSWRNLGMRGNRAIGPRWWEKLPRRVRHAIMWPSWTY